MPNDIIIKDQYGNGSARVVDGRLQVDSTATLEVSDIQIGAVEIKDGSTDNRASVDSDGKLLVTLDTDLIHSIGGQETVATSIFHEVTINPSKVSSATNTAITVGATSTTVLALNADRKEAILVNDSDEDIYLKYGSGATMNSGIRLNAQGGSLVEDQYTGIITAICASGSKVLTVVEK